MSSRLIVFALITALAGVAAAQSIYRYQDDDGRWHYTDRPPKDGREATIDVVKQINLDPKVIVTREKIDGGTTVYANNQYHGAVEFEIRLFDTQNIGGGVETDVTRVVLPPAEKTPVLKLAAARADAGMSFRYEYKYMLGEPQARHASDYLYRVPYAVAQRFRVSQAYPMAITHNASESQYAVDFVMPVGTAIHAARDGTVVAIAFRSFSGGTDAEDAPKANIVRIVHDDGTIATYAHLRLDSVRVRPGDTVQRGEYIADSGNTGFSSGPHLHFAVGHNTGFNLESVPIHFLGPGGKPVVAKSGQELLAH
ncbi:MAG: M23 family metallopeptidase [Gammaproteobacteria bacterium]|nr:M23 family metallopeptidase [Gammaproteobacteria bacterium]MDH3767342.1 M23 family metallopeptidase [Gammaproteobacteria bacterium]